MTKHITLIAVVMLLGAAVACSPDAKFSDRQLTSTPESSVKVALTKFRIDAGDYPTTAEGLGALLERPKSGSKWKGPYIGATGILDKWGTEYRYRYPGVKNQNGYDLWSLGADRVESADDITNWAR